MKRKQFIQTTLLGSAALGLFPSWTLMRPHNPFTQDQLIGKGNPDISGDSYTSTMHHLTKGALKKMQSAALEDGVKIEVVSAYRSFQRQKEIYEGKYHRFTGDGMSPEAAIEKIIEYSTIPGTSRHHWGTDLDIIDGNASRPKSVLLAENYHGKGPYCKLKEWLDLHASTFGFYETYTDLPERKGFSYEPWHWSYAPVSVPMLKAYKKLDLKQILQKEAVAGSAYFTDDFITRYRKQNILDINPILLG